jgi:phage nucleotide-binding protein
MKFQSVDESIDSHGIKVLISGQSGVGKTTLASTLEGKTLLISAESGLLSLKGKAKNVSVFDLSKDGDKLIPLEQRFTRLVSVYNFLKNEKHDFTNVFLDSLTEVNECLIAALKLKYTDAKNTLQLYGENKEKMISLAKSFRDLPMNVIIVSLSSFEKDDIGRRFVTADVVGSVAERLPSLFDEVFYMAVHKDDKGTLFRNLQCQPSDGIVSKDRSGKLNMFEKPNLSEVFKKIKGE